MALQLTILLIVLSLPGLLLRRGHNRWTRACTFLVMLGVLVAALDIAELFTSHVPARLTVVTTGPADETVARALRVAAGKNVELDFVKGSRDPGDRLAGARLRQRSDPDLAVVLNGRLADHDVGEAGDASAQVLLARPVLPFDPERIKVRAVGGLSKGRPAVFEVLLGERNADGPELQGTLRVWNPAGELVSETSLPGDPVHRVEWHPIVEGKHRVQLSLVVGEWSEAVAMRGIGTVEVSGPPKVTIVGAAATSLAKALRVQGLSVVTAAALPSELTGTLVLLDPLVVKEQQRVRRFVEDGGGAFLVGGRTGGALPPPTEPLGAIAPVIRLALPAAEDVNSKPEPGTPAEQPAKSSEDVPPPKENPPLPKQELPAKGDTSGAKLKVEERDVHRRKIAMVILVDRSGSMADEVGPRRNGRRMTKMDLAKESAIHTAAALDDGDELAVISFGSDAVEVLPLSSVKNRSQIEKSLEGLRALPEGTLVAGALDKARQVLSKSKASVKHVVIVTDGAISDAGGRTVRAYTAARKFHEQQTGITLSLVQAVPLGSKEARSATRGKQLVAAGNNVQIEAAKQYFFYVQSFDKVPRLLSTEVRSLRTRAGRPADKAESTDPVEKPLEQPEPDPVAKPEPVPENKPSPPPPPDPFAGTLLVQAIEDSPLVAPVPAAGFPRIAGILPVEAHAEALTLLVAGPTGIPLLAFANRGLGKLGVWTSDFLGDWGAAFCDDAAFPGRLGQWVQFLVPARTVLRGVDVVRRPTVTPGIPLAEDVKAVERIGGNAITPLDALVPPASSVLKEQRGRAEFDAIYGIVLLLLLAMVEFLVWRRVSSSS